MVFFFRLAGMSNYKVGVQAARPGFSDVLEIDVDTNNILISVDTQTFTDTKTTLYLWRKPPQYEKGQVACWLHA